MKQNLVAAFVASGSLMALMASAAPDRLRTDYELGVAVGYCLAAKCQIFRGSIETERAESGKPVVVKPVDYILGERHTTETVSLPYRREGEVRADDFGGALADLWSNVRVARGVQITVTLGLKEGFGVRPGEPTFLTAGERESDIVRSLARAAARFSDSPDSILTAVHSLSVTADAPLAGMIATLACYGDAGLGAEARASVLLGLLGSSSVPPGAQGMIAAWMSIRFSELPPDLRFAMVHRLAELGGQRDRQLAVAAFHGLADILRSDHSAASFLSPEVLAALGGIYRKMIGEKALAGDTAVDIAFASRTGR